MQHMNFTLFVWRGGRSLWAASQETQPFDILSKEAQPANSHTMKLAFSLVECSSLNTMIGQRATLLKQASSSGCNAKFPETKHHHCVFMKGLNHITLSGQNFLLHEVNMKNWSKVTMCVVISQAFSAKYIAVWTVKT